MPTRSPGLDAVRAQQPGGALRARVEQPVVQNEVVELDRRALGAVGDGGGQFLRKVRHPFSSCDAPAVHDPGRSQMRTLKLAAVGAAVSLLFILPGSALAAKGTGLWKVYNQTLSKARYIDLTHTHHAEHAGVEGLRPGDVQARGRPDHGHPVHVREGRLRGDRLRRSRPTSSAPSSTRRRTGRPSTRASTSCRRPTPCGRWW